MKPGKPTTLARLHLNNIPVFALPGNPVSCFVTVHLLVIYALRLMESPQFDFPIVKVTVLDKVKLDEERPEYQRVMVYATPKGLVA